MPEAHAASVITGVSPPSVTSQSPPQNNELPPVHYLSSTPHYNITSPPRHININGPGLEDMVLFGRLPVTYLLQSMWVKYCQSLSDASHGNLICMV